MASVQCILGAEQPVGTGLMHGRLEHQFAPCHRRRNIPWFLSASALQCRHNGRDCVSNHRLLYCLLNRLFRRRSKKTPKLRVTGVCERNSPVTGEFPAQRTSNAKNVSIRWRHHEWAPWHAVVSEALWWGLFRLRNQPHPERAGHRLRNVGVQRCNTPDSKVHGANMGPTWVLSAPDGPHVGPMNLAISD